MHLDASGSLHDTSDRLNAALTAEARGWLAVAEGNSAEARDHFRAGADDALVVGDRLGASHLLSALARTGGAADAVDDLERLAATVQGDLIGVQLAVACALAGPDDADSLLAVALDCELRGLLVEAAELAACAARELRRAGHAQAGARAAAQGRDRLGRCQRVQTPLLLDLSTAVPLTARELDVARLAADRRSSKEIAQQLGIAKRTVDNHLRNVYQKLDISGRADLADALGIETGASSPSVHD
jgi:DNA-binding CsgD family transcriptional regulator